MLLHFVCVIVVALIISVVITRKGLPEGAEMIPFTS